MIYWLAGISFSVVFIALPDGVAEDFFAMMAGSAFGVACYRMGMKEPKA